MDKWQRRDTGYEYNYPDGVYEVCHIIFMEEPIEKQHCHSRIVEIKDGKVVFPKPNDKALEWSYKIDQLSFFEVNFVMDYLPLNEI